MTENTWGEVMKGEMKETGMVKPIGKNTTGIYVASLTRATYKQNVYV